MGSKGDESFVGRLVWTPPDQETECDRFRRKINTKYGLSLKNYFDLHKWSVDHYPQFWEEVWHYVGLIYSEPYTEVVDPSASLVDGPEWFKGARLNYAENILRYDNDRVAFYVSAETKKEVDRVTFSQLRQEVALYAAGLKKAGVKEGDRVAGYITSSLPAAAALLATISLGCVWSAVSLEFGPHGVLDRLKQILPKVLFASDYSFREGKKNNFLERLKTILPELPSLEKVVICPFNKDSPEDISQLPKSCHLSEFRTSGRDPDGVTPPLEFVQTSFSTPSFISYTSGTTGPPKALVHSGGSVLLQMLKEIIICEGLTKNDTVQMFATVGWATFNMLPTYLAAGVSTTLLDGSPNYPKTRIWDLVDDMGTTVLFAYPYMMDKSEMDNVKPRISHKLDTLQHIFLGASCPKPNNWDYIFKEVKPGIHACSVTGATDIMGYFGGFLPSLPVVCGEIEAPSLGLAMECFDEKGKSVLGEKGDLVITKPIPSFPLYLWNDERREKLNKTYFSQYPGVWTQGDLIMINPETKGIITLGRSDSTLNPKGSRFGSSEIYNVVENIKGIEDSICVAQYNKSGDERVVLFLKLAPGYTFSQTFVKKVEDAIKSHLTESHCPGVILEVKDIPYTVTGKKVELAVKKAIAGEEVPYRRSIINPESLDLYYNLPELQGF